MSRPSLFLSFALFIQTFALGWWCGTICAPCSESPKPFYPSYLFLNYLSNFPRYGLDICNPEGNFLWISRIVDFCDWKDSVKGKLCDFEQMGDDGLMNKDTGKFICILAMYSFWMSHLVGFLEIVGCIIGLDILGAMFFFLYKGMTPWK